MPPLLSHQYSKHRDPALLLLLVLSIIYWHKIIIFHQTMFFDLTTRYFYPISAVLAEAVKSFELPFWNPYIFCGMPFLSNPQNAVFYPFSYIFVFLQFPVALNCYILLHTLIAGYFMYFLACEYGMNRYGAVTAALVFMFNGFYTLHTEFLSNVASYAWIPAILLYFRKYVTTPSLKNVILVSLAIALQFFGGHPGYSYYTMLFIAAYYIWHKYEFTKIINSTKSALIVFFSVALLSLLFTAIQIVPSIELIKSSVRDSGLDFNSSVTYSINPADFIKFFFMPLWDWCKPFYSGDVHVIGFYFSFSALVGVLVNITKIRTREQIFFAVIFVLSVLLALGKYFPLYSFFYHFVPGWKYFRFPAQAMLIATLCFSVLTGFMISALKSKYLRIILMFMIFTELFLFNLKANRFIDLSYYSENTQNLSFLAGDKSLFRIALTPKTQSEPPEDNTDYYRRWLNFKDMLYPNTGAAYGISYIDGYETIKQKSVNELLGNIKGPSSPILDIMNMKYMLSKWEIKDKNYKLVKDGYIKIYENTTCLPRFYFAKQAVFCDKKDIISNLLDVSSNPHDIVFIEGRNLSEGENLPLPSETILNGITVNRHSLGKSDITTISSNEGWLVYSQSYYPGWRAEIDGRLTEIHKANYNFMAIHVPLGRHRIIFSYYPSFFKLGALISIISLLAALICLIIGEKLILLKQDNPL